jgi:putative ABC transport system substrate-binding protein
MDRRRFLLTSLAGAFAAPLASEAQQTRRVGWLTPTAGMPIGLRDALRDFGWVEGQTIVFEVRQAEGRREQLPDLAADLIRNSVDVILASAPAAIRAAKQATTKIPIVMSWWGGPDLVQSGIIASFARPGGNVTGVHMVLQALDAKRLDLLREAVPSARTVAVLIHGRSLFEPQLPPVRDVARKIRLDLHLVDTTELGGYEAAFDAIAKASAQAVLVMSSPDFNRDRKLIIELAARRRVPAVYDWGDTARDGGLIGYGATFAELYRLSASFVDRILRGAKPADLPVQQPTKFELVINMKTAKALGLTIPRSLLLRADHVIE